MTIDIESLKAKQDIQGLIAALKDSDKNVRQAAALALGELRDASAIEPLLNTLKDTESSVRQCVIKSLVDLGWQPDQSEDAAWFLIARLKAGGLHDRPEITQALSKIGPNAVHPLIALIKEDTGKNNTLGYAECAAKALAGMETPSAEVKESIAPLMVMLTEFGKETKAVALQTLNKIDPEWPKSEEARQGFSLLEKIIKNETRRRGYQSPDNETIRRSAAINVLAALQAPLSEPLVSAVACWTRTVSMDARRVLEKYYPDWPKSEAAKQAIPALIAAFGPESSAPQVGAMNSAGIEAENALVAIGTPAVDSLINAMNDKDARVRAGAARILGKLGAVQAVEILEIALNDQDEDVRTWAKIALEELPKNDK